MPFVMGILSPLRFNFVVDALSCILDSTTSVGHIFGVVSQWILGGISHLQYADDTIILVKK